MTVIKFNYFNLLWNLDESYFIAVVGSGGGGGRCNGFFYRAIVSHTQSPSALITLVRWQVCREEPPSAEPRLIWAASASRPARRSRRPAVHYPPVWADSAAADFTARQMFVYCLLHNSLASVKTAAPTHGAAWKAFTACWKWFVLATANLYCVPHSLVRLTFFLLLWRLCYVKGTVARTYGSSPYKAKLMLTCRV